MRLVPIHKCEIKNGKIILENKIVFDLWIGSLEGQKSELTIGPERNDRSRNQNNYWHGVIIPLIAEWIGEEDKESVCFLLKKKFLGFKKTIKGKEYEIVPSTSRLSVVEMQEFIDKVIIWAGKQGITIPDPQEVVIKE